eukprot:Skav229883  [mRNA]  locus=scaffold247:363431:367994:+ [translate_table: standard]
MELVGACVDDNTDDNGIDGHSAPRASCGLGLEHAAQRRHLLDIMSQVDVNPALLEPNSPVSAASPRIPRRAEQKCCGR